MENGHGISNGGKATGLKHGDKLYARLWDGVNGGKEASIDIRDNIAPVVTITANPYRSDTITVNLSIKEEESGFGTNPQYKYYLKLTSATNYSTTPTYTGAERTHTFGNLKQNTSYDIKVEVQDIAGNAGTGTLENILTPKVAGAETRRSHKF